MKTRRTLRPYMAALFLTGCTSALWALTVLSTQPQARLAAPPYPEALDAAAVVESKIADINREAFTLGNGDLNGLLWDSQGSLCLRVAKNDIWDARVVTAGDPPMLKVNVASNNWTGGGYPGSYNQPYPTPRCAAVIRMGAASAKAGTWQCIRSGGRVNEWVKKNDVGVMSVEGAAGASAGYRWNLDSTKVIPVTALKLSLSGTAGAQYYVNIYGEAGKTILESGWRDTPAAEQDVAIPVPADSKVTAIELYVMTKEGARTENRIRQIALDDGQTITRIPVGMKESGVKSARLDLRRAVGEVEEAGHAHTTVRVLADRNVFLIDSAREVSLEEIKSAQLPAAEMGETRGVKWVHMNMPGDLDYKGMEYALAVAARGNHKAVAVVTSFDTKEPVVEAACRLARETIETDPASLVAKHEDVWNTYWAASGVALDDPDFQHWWYRMVYMLRCFSRPGATVAGLFPFLSTDAPPWHGDIHHNYNAWQPYWTSFVINHPDLAEPWIRYMKEMLPRLRWLAKTTYDCEGAFVGISSFVYEPDPAVCKSVNSRQIALTPWGYTLGMIGMSVQNLWYSHLYAPDRKYLEEMIYPVLREAALFFCSFVEKCPRDAQGKAIFGPSYSPEHGEFGVANVPFDIAYARFSMKAAIAAAGELGCDKELVARLGKAIDILPPYPTAPDAAGKDVVVDWTGCKFRQIGEHNIVVPVVPVFPADQVTWFSSELEKELFRNTIVQTKHRGCNSTVMFSVIKARLSIPDALEDARKYYKPEVQPNGMFSWPSHGFYLSESVGIAAMISEYLVQSVGDIIRVFPCWPKDKNASFTDLRAQGGFLVTAEQKDGKIVKLEITSTVGGKLRLLNPWTGKIDERETKQGERIEVKP